ncbi:NTP transferase domain-containing protein [Chenggangzhangella methanolivorans]|uniref:NTP transferase domain-containing protein n=1 Tax=Chenggangzhangella methanolivorans TaxID=1437009 RepID=UPI00361F1444
MTEVPAGRPLTVLLLAGQREGRVDPLAEATGVTLKAMVPVAGCPMLLHALTTLAKTPTVGRIVVSINAGSGIESLPEVAALIRDGRLDIRDARPNLVDSVFFALEGQEFPVLITTADNVLLTPATVREIDGAARARGADVAVALARREDVLAAHPDGQRRFYRFGCGYYSNCNSYWIGARSALAPAELFRTGGQFVKHPSRVIGALGVAGLFELVRFRFGLGTLEQGCARLSKRFGLDIRPVVVSDGATAIDVDAERSLKVAEEVIARRRAATDETASRRAPAAA